MALRQTCFRIWPSHCSTANSLSSWPGADKSYQHLQVEMISSTKKYLGSSLELQGEKKQSPREFRQQVGFYFFNSTFLRKDGIFPLQVFGRDRQKGTWNPVHPQDMFPATFLLYVLPLGHFQTQAEGPDAKGPLRTLQLPLCKSLHSTPVAGVMTPTGEVHR